MGYLITPVFSSYNNSVQKEARQSLRRNQTDTERTLWQKIRSRQLFGFKFVRQFGIGPYILDFYCQSQRVAIELDGGQHAEGEQKANDTNRDLFLKSENIQILRFWNNEVLQNMDGVLARIVEVLKESASR